MLRLSSSLGVLDITEYFSESSGGIRTYLLAKSRFVERHPEYRQVLVFPGAEEQVAGTARARLYRLRGPRIPLNPQYRLLLTSRTPQRIIEEERPDLIEVGSHLLVPWIARRANRRAKVPLVWFYHGDVPRLIAPDHSRSPLQRIVEALGWADNPDVLPTIARAAAADSPELRSAALRAAAKVGHPSVANWVIGLLDDQTPFVRVQATNCCASLGLSAAVPKLQELLDDEELWVRLRAEHALDVLVRNFPSDETFGEVA